MNFIEENEISKFYIVDGESFNKDTKGIWLDNFFAEENNLKIGDTLKVKYDGYVFEEKIDNVAVINIEDTASYKQYQGEIEEGETYIGVFSGLFLFIALLSVVTTMNRVVKKQRLQIGTLKALGFKQRKIIMHYISYSFWISLVGALLGLVAGRYFIGNVFIGLEMSFFEIPNVKNKSLNITTTGIFKKMSFNTKWNIRDMFRNKARTITGIVGITACAMLIVCSFGMMNSMNYFIDLQFNRIFNFEYKLSLKSDISTENLKDLTHWLFKTAIEEHYDFGAHINLISYVLAALGTFVISYVVSKILAKKIRKIDMVTSLKGNE